MKKYYKNSLYAAFLAPAIILYTVFLIAPAFVMIPISFQKNNGIVCLDWVGWENYKTLFSDGVFWRSQLNVLKMYLVGLLAAPFSWIFAFWLNRTTGWVSKLFRFAALFPAILAITSIGKLFQGVFNANWGLLNSFLEAIHLESLKHSWLSSKSTAIWCIAFVSVYSGFGTGIIIKNAAIKSIPKNYAEAAMLDGCTPTQVDWLIYFPLMRNLIQYSLITGVVGTLCTYAIVEVMTITASNHTSTPISQIVNTSMTKMQFGLGCAMALIFFIECVVIAFIVTKLTDWENVEY